MLVRRRSLSASTRGRRMTTTPVWLPRKLITPEISHRWLPKASTMCGVPGIASSLNMRLKRLMVASKKGLMMTARMPRRESSAAMIRGYPNTRKGDDGHAAILVGLAERLHEHRPDLGRLRLCAALPAAPPWNAAIRTSPFGGRRISPTSCAQHLERCLDSAPEIPTPHCTRRITTFPTSPTTGGPPFRRLEPRGHGHGTVPLPRRRTLHKLL